MSKANLASFLSKLIEERKQENTLIQDYSGERKLAAAVVLSWMEDVKQAAKCRNVWSLDVLSNWPKSEIGSFWCWAAGVDPEHVCEFVEKLLKQIQRHTSSANSLIVIDANSKEIPKKDERAKMSKKPENGKRYKLIIKALKEKKSTGSKRVKSRQISMETERVDLGKKTLRAERTTLGKKPEKKERVTTLENSGIRKRALQPENSLNPKRAKDSARLRKKTSKSERALAGKRAAFSKKTRKEERAMPYQISKTEERTWQDRWTEVEARLRQMLGGTL